MTEASPPPPKGRVKVMSLVLRFGGLALAVWLVLRLVEARTLWESLATVNGWYLVLSFVVGFGRTMIGPLRWQALFPAKPPPAYRPLLWTSIVSGTVGAFLPGATMGADVMRSVLLKTRSDVTIEATVASIVADRLVALMVMLVMALCAIPMAEGLPRRPLYAALLGAALLTVIAVALVGRSAGLHRMITTLFSRLGRLGARAAKMLGGAMAAFRLSASNPRGTLLSMGYSLVFHLLGFTYVKIFAVAASLEIELAPLIVVTVLVWIIMVVPVSVGGIGVRELSFAMLLSKSASYSRDKVVLFSALQSGMRVIGAVIWAPLLIWTALQRKKPQESGEPSSSDD